MDPKIVTWHTLRNPDIQQYHYNKPTVGKLDVVQLKYAVSGLIVPGELGQAIAVVVGIQIFLSLPLHALRVGRAEQVPADVRGCKS